MRQKARETALAATFAAEYMDETGRPTNGRWDAVWDALEVAEAFAPEWWTDTHAAYLRGYAAALTVTYPDPHTVHTTAARIILHAENLEARATDLGGSDAR